MRPATLSLLAVVALLVAACGGAVDTPTTNKAPNEPGGSGAGNGGSQGGSSGSNAGGSSGGAPIPEPCAEPVCDPGHTQVAATDACVSGDACYTRESCGTKIACTGPAGLCEEPDCVGAKYQVTQCPPDAPCEEQRICDTVLLCAGNAQCDAVPTCDDDSEKVRTADECAKSCSRCYARTTCGVRIYCVRNA